MTISYATQPYLIGEPPAMRQLWKHLNDPPKIYMRVPHMESMFGAFGINRMLADGHFMSVHLCHPRRGLLVHTHVGRGSYAAPSYALLKEQAPLELLGPLRTVGTGFRVPTIGEIFREGSRIYMRLLGANPEERRQSEIARRPLFLAVLLNTHSYVGHCRTFAVDCAQIIVE